MRLPSPVGEGGPLAVDELAFSSGRRGTTIVVDEVYYSSVIQLASRRVHDSFPHKGSHDCGGKLYPTLDIKIKLWLSFKVVFVTVTFIILPDVEKSMVSIFSYSSKLGESPWFSMSSSGVSIFANSFCKSVRRAMTESKKSARRLFLRVCAEISVEKLTIMTEIIAVIAITMVNSTKVNPRRLCIVRFLCIRCNKVYYSSVLRLVSTSRSGHLLSQEKA